MRVHYQISKVNQIIYNNTVEYFFSFTQHRQYIRQKLFEDSHGFVFKSHLYALTYNHTQYCIHKNHCNSGSKFKTDFIAI